MNKILVIAIVVLALITGYLLGHKETTHTIVVVHYSADQDGYEPGEEPENTNYAWQ